MRIAAFYSHLNGREHILVHQPTIWAEVEEVIASVGAGAGPSDASKQADAPWERPSSRGDIAHQLKATLRKRGWHDASGSCYVPADSSPMPQARKARLTKGRVALEVNLGTAPATVYDLLAQHMASFAGDRIDVGIEVLPMRELQTGTPTSVPCYESVAEELADRRRSLPVVPLVLIGVVP